MANRIFSLGNRTPAKPSPSIDGHPLPVKRSRRPFASWRRWHIALLLVCAATMTALEAQAIRLIVSWSSLPAQVVTR